jgi:hypothetical protein
MLKKKSTSSTAHLFQNCQTKLKKKRNRKKKLKKRVSKAAAYLFGPTVPS